MQDHFNVVVVGAGAAGIAALRRLRQAGVSSLALEARPRLGGRAHTIRPRPDLLLDLGAGWLHSADGNPLVELIEEAGFAVDRTPPDWGRQAGNLGFPPEEQRAFAAAFEVFEQRLEAAARTGIDRPAAEFLEPGCRWNPLIDAVSSYYNGAEHAFVSVLDYAAYQDSEVNWRVADGYGAAVAALARAERILSGCPVLAVCHDGAAIRLETPAGPLTARAVIITVPTPLIANGGLVFAPDLPKKREAAAALPLGLADKVFLGWEGQDDLPAGAHLFGRTDRTETGSYHLRPFGRPYVEGYLGGRLARALEAEDPRAMAVFAIEELASLLGSDVRRKLKPLARTAWASDPFALGAYSHALPGQAGARAVLAEPVDGRIFFAGEATSPHAFSTVHGAWESGLRAAGEVLAAI